MKTIIAPTDFSEVSINAVRFAADMALAVNAQLQIYHAVADHVLLIDEMDYDIEFAQTEKAMRQLELLQEEIERYTQHRLAIVTQMESGNIDQVLAKTCKHDVPFAVVMAATEKTDAERFWLGSETLSISHKIQVPLLLIPHAAVFAGIKKMAIASDLTDVYNTMPFDMLTGWIEMFKPALDIVYVKGDNKFKAHNVSEAVALQTHFEKYYPALHYIQNDNIAAGINNFLDGNRPDLLVIIPKKHAPFHKSLSRQFILHPTIPTMILSNHH